jgi:general stress protein YciG
MINENDDQNVSQATVQSTEVTEKLRKPRGFAAMDPKLVSELAKRGGKAAHRAGTAHQFTSDEARVAGRKGGMATHAKRRESVQLKPSN